MGGYILRLNGDTYRVHENGVKELICDVANPLWAGDLQKQKKALEIIQANDYVPINMKELNGFRLTFEYMSGVRKWGDLYYIPWWSAVVIAAWHCDPFGKMGGDRLLAEDAIETIARRPDIQNAIAGLWRATHKDHTTMFRAILDLMEEPNEDHTPQPG